jgi:hypothetical protein
MPPLFKERIGGDFCACNSLGNWRFSVDEACAGMFYVFLSYGGVMRCIGNGHYLDKCVDGIISGGDGVVECRQVQRY